MIEKKHRGMEGNSILPLMAREIFVSSLRENGIDLYVADGKAMKTIVCLVPTTINGLYWLITQTSVSAMWREE